MGGASIAASALEIAKIDEADVRVSLQTLTGPLSSNASVQGRHAGSQLSVPLLSFKEEQDCLASGLSFCH